MITLQLRLPEDYAAILWFRHPTEPDFSQRGTVSSRTSRLNGYLSPRYCMNNNEVMFEFPEGFPHGGIVGHLEAEILETETWYDPGDENNPPLTKRRVIFPPILEVRTDEGTVDMGSGFGDLGPWDLSNVLTNGDIEPPGGTPQPLHKCPHCDLRFSTQEELDIHLARAHGGQGFAFVVLGENFPIGAYSWQFLTIHGSEIATPGRTDISTARHVIEIPDWQAVVIRADVWDRNSLLIISLGLQLPEADALADKEIDIDFRAGTIFGIPADVIPIPEDQRSPYAPYPVDQKTKVLAVTAIGLAAIGMAAYTYQKKKRR